jgi:hypothetical protein
MDLLTWAGPSICDIELRSKAEKSSRYNSARKQWPL